MGPKTCVAIQARNFAELYFPQPRKTAIVPNAQIPEKSSDGPFPRERSALQFAWRETTKFGSTPAW